MDGDATSAVLSRAGDRGMAGGMNSNATPARLGRSLVRGVPGSFDATEKAVFGVALAADVHVCSKRGVHVCSNILVSPEERLSSRTWSVRGSSLAPAGSELVDCKGLFRGSA